MTAGPTPVPPAVSQAMATPMLYHRAPAFVELYERVLAKLPKVFQTSNDVLTFAASGSGAMDSAAANLIRPGTKVLACAAGKFGERWIELAEAYGADLTRYEPGWGERLDPSEIGRLAEGQEVVFATLSETSTGIVNDIQAIAEAVGDTDPRRRRRLRPRRRRAQAGRVGRRRRRRGLPEGADDPARPGLRVRQPEGARLRRGNGQAAATTSTGSRPRSRSERATPPSRPPCRSSRRSTSRST